MPIAITTPTDSTRPTGAADSPGAETPAREEHAAGWPAAPSRRNALQRAFPRRDFFRSPALVSVLLSVAAALLLGVLLGGVLLTARFLESTSVALTSAVPTDVGIEPVVREAEETVWGGLLEGLYEAVPWLQHNITALATLLLIVLAVAALYRAVLALSAVFAARAGLDVATRLRRSLHRQALRVGPADMLESEHRQAMLLFTRDADCVKSAVGDRVYGIGWGTARIAVLAALALLVEWRVALQCLIPLGCGWYLFERASSRRDERRRAREAARRKDLDHLAEAFVKSRIIRGYGMENFEHGQFQNAVERHREFANRTTLRQQIERWAGWALACLTMGVILFFVGVKVLQPDGLSFASGTFLLLTFGLLYQPAGELGRLPGVWSAAVPSAERIYRYLDRIPEVSQAVGAKFLQPLSTAMQFEAVRYDVPDRGAVLRGVDLKLPAGKTVAFVSIDPLESRALAYLLPRFIEPSSGRVLIDGEDIAWVTLESLRAETAYVGGEAPWFSGSVLENIRCGDERRSLQEVTDAAKAVHAHKFISRLPHGYETVLGEQSLRLSPGEAFRLALARAVLQQPALMIIEEPAEALDADTKSLVDDAYNRILKDRTVIFLPSRLSTVRRADVIVLLHEGKLEAIGKHSALVSSSAAYRHWEYTRFNQFRNGNGTAGE